jgi:hypothetical protein
MLLGMAFVYHRRLARLQIWGFRPIGPARGKISRRSAVRFGGCGFGEPCDAIHGLARGNRDRRTPIQASVGG